VQTVRNTTIDLWDASSHSNDLCDCEPFVHVPAWWSGFLFHILAPRQISVYTYIAMLGSETGLSSPTVREIQHDMNLASDTVVFDAIRALEDVALIQRMRLRGSGPNVYRRPACETTLIRLLETNRIDASLRPATSRGVVRSQGVRKLTREGLKALLGADYEEYRARMPGLRRDFLLQCLRARLAQRIRTEREFCTCSLVQPVGTNGPRVHRDRASLGRE
jgi:hypothetical protein